MVSMREIIPILTINRANTHMKNQMVILLLPGPDLLDTLPMEFPEPFVPAVVDSAGSKSEPPETSGTMDAGSIIARQRTLKLGEVPSDDDACADHKVGQNICSVNILGNTQKHK